MKRSKTADKTPQSSRRKGFTTDDYKRMIALYESGQSSKEVAEEFGCSFGRVLQVLHEHGVNVRACAAKKFTDLDHQNMAAQYEQGKTCQEIADTFACSSTAVKVILGKLGTKMRPKSCRKSGWNPNRLIPRKPKRIKDIPEDVRTKIVTMYEDGHSQKKIESHFSLTKKEIRQVLNAAGVARRTDTQFQPRYTENDHRRMVKMYEQGHSLREIADEFGCVRSALTRIFEKQGVHLPKPAPRHKFTPEDYERIRDMSAKGYRNTEIAEELGCTQCAVGNILRREYTISLIHDPGHYSTYEKQRMKALYGLGLSTGAIAEEFGCGKKVVRFILTEQNVTLRPNKIRDKISAKNRRQILIMCENGTSGTEIVEKFGIDLATISMILKNEGGFQRQPDQTVPIGFGPKVLSKRQEKIVTKAKMTLDTFIREFWEQEDRAVQVMMMPEELRVPLVKNVNEALKHTFDQFKMNEPKKTS